MFTGLHHFNLIVSDMEKTKEFYNRRLGLEIALETVIEDPEFSRGVGLPGTKVLATFFKLPNNPGLIETFQYVHPFDVHLAWCFRSGSMGTQEDPFHSYGLTLAPGKERPGIAERAIPRGPSSTRGRTSKGFTQRQQIRYMPCVRN